MPYSLEGASATLEAERNWAKGEVLPLMEGLKSYVENFWDRDEFWNDVDWPDHIDVGHVAKIIDIPSIVRKLDTLDTKAPTFTYNFQPPSAFNTRQLVDQKFDALEAEVIRVLNNGGYIINPNLQTALWEKDKERRDQTLQDSLALVDSVQGGKGFEYPTHFLTGARNEIIQKHQFDETNRSREILISMEEAIRKGWEFCINQGIEIEKIHVGFIQAYAAMFKQNVEAIVTAYRAEVDAYIAKMNAELRKLLGAIEANNAYRTGEIEVIKAQIAAFSANVDRSYKELVNIVTDRTNEAQAHIESIKSASSTFMNIYKSLAEEIINVNSQSQTTG